MSAADGTMFIGHSKVTLDQIVSEFEGGAIADEIAEKHRELSLSDVFIVLSFYLRHRKDVEAYLETRAKARRRPKPAA